MSNVQCSESGVQRKRRRERERMRMKEREIDILSLKSYRGNI
jgi:hypothetical protein